MASLSQERVILHVDMDCFFVQCERLRDPDLLRKPVAVTQHEDIISVSYEARALGVRKHDLPQFVAERFKQVTLVHVPHEPGTTKVSYKTYQDVSDDVMSIISEVANTCEIEEASIDEAYIEASLAVGTADDKWDRAAFLGEVLTVLRACSDKKTDSRQEIRRTILERLGLHSSCGIGPNKMVAKMGSAEAKPDGQVVVKPCDVKGTSQGMLESRRRTMADQRRISPGGSPRKRTRGMPSTN